MQNVAQAWLVYRLTGSSALLGMVGFAGQIPVFLISPLGGLIADRHSRQRTVIATQTSAMILAFILAGLTLTGRVQVPHIFVLAALLGVVNAFDIPARQSFLVEMVGREDLINAIALNSSMFNGARIVGPAVAGILVAAIGEGWCFFANGVSYIAVIIGLTMIQVPRAAAPKKGSAISHIAEGFRFAARTTPIRALLLLLGLVSLTGMPYAVLMPVFADRIFHSGARGLGILMGFSGAGALIGALALATRQERDWSGPMGGGFHRRLRRQPDSVLVLAFLLDRGGAARPGWPCDDGANGSIQHADSNYDTRSSSRPRDVGLLDDVYGHGARRRAAGRCDGGPVRCALYSRRRRSRSDRRQPGFLPAPPRTAPGSPPVDRGPAHGWREIRRTK